MKRLTKAEQEKLIRAGRRLANTAYNLSQLKSIPIEHRTTLKDCQQDWDKALAAVRGNYE